MKNIIRLIVLTISMISCNEITNEPTTIEHLTIDNIKEYLPIEYFVDNEIIFINHLGEELAVKIHPSESTQEKSFNGTNFNADEFEIAMYIEDQAEFRLYLVADVDYNETGLSRALTGLLMPTNEGGSTLASLKFEEKSTPMINAWLNNYYEIISLNGKPFSDVFVFRGMHDGNQLFDAYSELDLNSEVGVVAFRDHDNVLWVFDRFKN